MSGVQLAMDLVGDIQRAYEERDGLDVSFTFDGAPATPPIEAHRFVLSSKSAVFRTMFKSGLRETRDLKSGNIVTIPVVDAGPQAFRTFIQYLYAYPLKSFFSSCGPEKTSKPQSKKRRSLQFLDNGPIDIDAVLAAVDATAQDAAANANAPNAAAGNADEGGEDDADVGDGATNTENNDANPAASSASASSSAAAKKKSKKRSKKEIAEARQAARATEVGILCELLGLANKFEVKNLTTDLIELISRSYLCGDHAAQFLVFAELYDIPKLVRNCKEAILSDLDTFNKVKRSDAFKKLSRGTVLSLLEFSQTQRHWEVADFRKKMRKKNDSIQRLVDHTKTLKTKLKLSHPELSAMMMLNDDAFSDTDSD